MLNYVTTDLLLDNNKTRCDLSWKPVFTLSRGVEEMVRE
jgi:nucleoside-diphosphate-sugar epimerase